MGINISPSVLIGGSLSLVAGLAWNDAFSETIKYYYPLESRSSIRARFIYAVIITITIVMIGYILMTIQYAGSILLQSSYAVISTIPQITTDDPLKAAIL
jgi:uncharacterized BrkB/YihY/UPF0761 family membrane protein